MTTLEHKISLVLALTRREIEQRHRGSFAGTSWYVINTLLSVGLYSWVFGTLFGARWTEAGRTPVSFALAIVIGLLIYNCFAECIQRAPTLILNNANYVTRVVFPLEVLPVVSIGTALFNLMIGIAIFVVVALASGQAVTWSVLYLPLILAPFVVLILGLMWFLASIGVFVRDTSQLINFVSMALMFLSPLFYPSQMLPEQLRTFMIYNPITIPMEMARAAALFGQAPDFSILGLYAAAALAVGVLGYSWFQATRRGFADVI